MGCEAATRLSIIPSSTTEKRAKGETWHTGNPADTDQSCQILQVFYIIYMYTMVFKTAAASTHCSSLSPVGRRRHTRGNISSFVLLFYFVVRSMYYIKYNRKSEQVYKINRV